MLKREKVRRSQGLEKLGRHEVAMRNPPSLMFFNQLYFKKR